MNKNAVYELFDVETGEKLGDAVGYGRGNELVKRCIDKIDLKNLNKYVIFRDGEPMFGLWMEINLKKIN